MKYVKAQAKVVQFGQSELFLITSTDTDYFHCSDYRPGEYCGQISWINSGITCKGYSQRHCPEVTRESGEPVYDLVCNHF